MKDDTPHFQRALVALAELGPALTSSTDFRQTAREILTMIAGIAGSRAAVLFRFSDKPLMLSSLASTGFSEFSDDAVIPLLPKHAYALGKLRTPSHVDTGRRSELFSTDGNFNPELLKCIVPLRVGRKLVGLVGLGEHVEAAEYSAEELRAVEAVGHYVAIAIHNQDLSETLAARISDNLKLLSSIHTFYDSTMEVLAAAIDIKHVNIQGHSLQVGTYSAGIAQALGMAENDIAGVRAAGYLHDIGKVAVDSYLFAKSEALNDAEFQQIADHTILGYKIVKDVHFPWASIPDVVRSHHERVDGSGYPDGVPLADMPPEVKIVALADTFDAMTSDRPYRPGMTVGQALMALVNLTPSKFDADPVQALILQVRRDAAAAMNPATIGSPERSRFLHEGLGCDFFPSDIDQIAALLNHKISRGRTYFDPIH